MLLVSYMLAASLELAIVLLAVQAHQSIAVWAYGFLLLSSVVSIPIETGETGRKIRREMSEQGICIDCYDLASNLLRSIVYLTVIAAAVTPVNGALLAYGIAIISVLLALHKMK